MRLRAFLLLVLLLTGCARARLAADGDRAYARGDWDAAADFYGQALAADPGDPALTARHDASRQHAAARHAGLAAESAAAGDLNEALHEIRKARLRRDEPRWEADERKYASLRLEVRRHFERACAADPEEAFRTLTIIAWAEPTFPEIATRRAGARAAWAADLLARAEERLRRADPEAALLLLARSPERDGPAETALLGRARAAAARDRRAKALALRDAGEPVAAAGWLLRAAELDAEAARGPEAEALRAAAAAELERRAREAREAGLPGLAWICDREARELAPGDALPAEEPFPPPTLLVRGFGDATASPETARRLSALAVAVLRDRSRGGRLARIVVEESAADLVVEGTLERFEVARLPDRVETGVKYVGAETSWNDGEPPAFEVFRVEYPITRRSIEGSASITLRIRVPGDAEPILETTVPAHLRYDDTVIRADPGAGIEGDPDETPGEEELRARLRRSLEEALEERLRGEFEWFGHARYRAYCRARTAGDHPRAVSEAVAALRALSEAGRARLDEDVDYVKEQTGWSLRTNRIVPEFLR